MADGVFDEGIVGIIDHWGGGGGCHAAIYRIFRILLSSWRSFMEHHDKNEVLTAREAAEMLKLHPNTVKLRANRGEIPHKRVGRSYRFLRSQLLEWLAAPTEPQD